MEFSEIVEKRYAVKLFDGRKVPEEKMHKLLEMIRMSASSFGLQPWKIKVISDAETKAKLEPATWGQKQITTCSHLLVICADRDIVSLIDKYQQAMIDGGAPADKAKGFTDYVRTFEQGLPEESKLAWAQKQCYIALGNALNGAASLGLGSCPMEGFDPKQYSAILQLPENLVPTLVVPVGYPADTPRAKLRFKKEDVFF
ncbi:malonic semialdehyde reductase RutE [uncultured archaeon]|nr:malonic semialdehyde reductase RutE [uncultured archaeon]